MAFQPIIIGNLTLDETYAPVASIGFEYYTTPGAEIIGGIQKLTVSGVATVADKPNDPGALLGTEVMSKLKSIRDIGSNPKCLDVTIPGFYTGKAKVMNISIEQGSDPAWINQGAYTIEISAPLPSIPPNRFNFTANDFVKDISLSEKVEIGEDAHGYIYSLSGGGAQLSKTYVKFTNEINLTCQPLCSNQSIPSIIDILHRIVTIGPKHEVFDKYKSWRLFLQSRSLQIQTTGSATFSCEIILVPPTIEANAFVDISFEHNRTYDPQQDVRSKKSSGTVSGLVSVGWSDLVHLSDTCSVSKLSNAEAAFSTIKNILSNLDNWEGIELELEKLANCPSNMNAACVPLFTSNLCYKPDRSTIAKSRTEGTITFDFEWNNSQCSTINGQTVVDVEIMDPQPSIAEFVIPDYGTLIQNLNCDTAQTFQFVGSTTYPGANGCTEGLLCSTKAALDKEIVKYIDPNSPNWLLIMHNQNFSSTAVSITKKYIRKCL